MKWQTLEYRAGMVMNTLGGSWGMIDDYGMISVWIQYIGGKPTENRLFIFRNEYIKKWKRRCFGIVI